MKYKSPYAEPIVGRKEFIEYAEEFIKHAEDISSLKDFQEFVLELNIDRYSLKNIKNWRKDALKALRLVNGRQLVRESEENNTMEFNDTAGAESLLDEFEPPIKKQRLNARNELDVHVPQLNLDDYVDTFPAYIINQVEKFAFGTLKSTIFSSVWPSMLINGPPFCGKSLLIESLAGKLAVNYFKVSVGVIQPNVKSWREIIDTAIKAAPCILHIDDIESMEKHSISIGSFRLTCFFKTHILKELMGKSVFLVGETRSLFASLPQTILDLFTQRVTFGMLETGCRINILKKLLSNGCSLKEPLTFELLAKKTPGYEVGDLHRLIAQARLSKVNSQVTGEETLTEDDFTQAMQIVVPSIKNTPEFVTVPNITFEDIGGLTDTKKLLNDRFMMLIDDWAGAKELDRKSTGVLLEGPPGCGKTLIAKALSNYAGLNFLNIKGPEVLNKYQGESERKIREIFERARACQPCLIFFDEIDAICPLRDSSETSGGRVSLVNQLLVELDGVDKFRSSRVFIVGATNRKDMIDPAILRSGRLGLHICIHPPSSPADRFDILMAITQKAKKPLIENAQHVIEKVSRDPRTAKMTGADLDNLLDFAKQNAHIGKRNYLIEQDFEFALLEILEYNKK